MNTIARIGSVLIILAGWAGPQDLAAGRASEMKEPSMTYENDAKISAPAIPPIDAAAPMKFETASFGLG